MKTRGNFRVGSTAYLARKNPTSTRWTNAEVLASAVEKTGRWTCNPGSFAWAAVVSS